VRRMVLRKATTSLQRTYRYLRLGIAGTVVVIFVAVAAAVPVAGVLPSISHYFYTPARTLFVGALIGASVCLFALSGRGAERLLLDVAALMLPLVAIVPTVVSPGSVPGLDVTCRDACVPAQYEADVAGGVITYLVVGAMILILAAALTVAGHVDRAGGGVSIAIGAAVLLTVGLGWFLARDAFLQWGHFASAVAFFALIAAVAFVNAFWPTGERRPSRGLKAAYIGIAVALLVDVAALPIFGPMRFGEVWGVLIGETIALLLFLAFWVLQSVQNWNDEDPAALRG
jgi:hypothetical protein